MTSIFGHNIRSDLIGLYAAEALAVFLAAYSILTWGLDGTAVLGDAQLGLVAAMLAVCSGLVLGASGLYQPEVLSRARRLATGSAVAMLLLLIAAWLCLRIIGPVGLSTPGLVAALAVGAVAGAISARFCYAIASRIGLPKRRLLIIRDPADPSPAAGQSEGKGAQLRTLEVCVADASGGGLAQAFGCEWLRAQNIWAIVAPGSAVDDTLRQHCRSAGVRLLSEDEFLECRLNRVAFDRLPQDWLSRARSTRPNRVEAALRRGFDIVVALALLLFTLPVMLVTALLVRLDSKGPVFYRQERSGLHRRSFTLYKFRSMVVDAEAGGTPRWATPGDPRVTPFGRLIRLTRIDELPQLLNVLRGDMALVGPRPERPGFVQQLGDIIPHYHDRASVKPGITGWAQVNYPYGASVEDARMKLAYDLYYVARRSLFLDLLILVATVRVVLFQEGAR